MTDKQRVVCKESSTGFLEEVEFPEGITCYQTVGGIDILNWFDDFKGKKVRITIEELK